MTYADFKPWIDFIQVVAFPALCYGVKILWDIRAQLIRLNGRVTTCEALRQAHELSDKEKHESCEERIGTIEHGLMGMR